MRWMHEHKQMPGIDALIAIVWARNGNLKKAKEHLTKALLEQQNREQPNT
jgi:hypothetical protein